MSLNPLAFQYQLRSSMLDGLDSSQRHVANEQRDRELEDYLGYLQTLGTQATPTAWTAIDLASGWSPSTGVASGWRRSGDVIQLRGLIERTGAATSGTTTIATFPVGERPVDDAAFAVPVGSGATVGRINITAAGDLTLTGPNVATGGTVSVAGVWWAAA